MNTQESDAKTAMLEALNAMVEASLRLSRAWEDVFDDKWHAWESYPFSINFEDVPHLLMSWKEEMEEKS